MKTLYYIFISIVSIIILIGCSATKHLKKDQYILYNNSLKGAPKDNYSNMTELYKQLNNRKIVGLLPYVNLYNFGKLFQDTSKINSKKEKINLKYNAKIKNAKSEFSKNLLREKKEKKIARKNTSIEKGNSFMRSFGEPPVIYDSSKVVQTVYSMKGYLFSKGYFNSQVYSNVDTSKHRKRISVRYTVKSGKPYVIDSIKYVITDTLIQKLINNPKIYTKTIAIKENYNEEKLNKERENIYKLLKDNGYFNFQRQSIIFNIDSLQRPYGLNINVIIEDKHKVYRVSKMFFSLNDKPIGRKEKLETAVRDTFLYRNIYYTYYKKTYLRKLLDYKITIRPFDIYNQSEFQKTQRLLSSMDIYKFANVNVFENKSDTINNTLTAYINSQSMNKFQLSQEYGLSVSQALIPGPFLSFTLKTRNIFRWLEVIENTFRYSFEAQYTNSSSTEPYRAREFSAYSSVGVSQLLIPSRLRDLLKNYNPKVKFYIGYTFVKRPEYRRESFKSGLTYSFSKNIYSSYFITPIDISFIDSKLDPTYNEFLNELKANGSNLYLSFNPSIVTSFQFSYVYNNNELNSKKITKYIRPSFDFGGFVPSIVAKKYASANDRDSSRLFNKQIFQYVRLGLDVRYYIPVQKKNKLVIRFNLGYAHPLANSNKEELYALPYEKYFFTGGNSSIRAWKPRRLGPGSYNGNSQKGYVYEEPGEILFETNYEYRFKLTGIFNGALFVDAGNVWTIKDDKEGAQFKFPKAIGDIAIGAGIGLRLDFSFLIIRLDAANKVVDPALPSGEKLNSKYGFGRAVYNLGIGYPF